MLAQRGTMCFLKFQSYVLGANGRSEELTQKQIKTKKKVLKKRLCLALLLLIFIALCIKYCFHRNNRTTCMSNISVKNRKKKNLHMKWILQLLITLPNDAKFSPQSLIFKVWRSKICTSCSFGGGLNMVWMWWWVWGILLGNFYMRRLHCIFFSNKENWRNFSCTWF